MVLDLSNITFSFEVRADFLRSLLLIFLFSSVWRASPGLKFSLEPQCDFCP
jgi:hypothetical protein